MVGVFATNHQPQVLLPYFAAKRKTLAKTRVEIFGAFWRLCLGWLLGTAVGRKKIYNVFFS